MANKATVAGTIKEITIHISRTINLGSYESVRIECGATASLDAGGPEALTEQMLPHIRKMLRAAYQTQVDEKGKGRDL